MMIAVGVDTHKHQHLAVAVDTLGQLLAEITITATLAGYRELLAWIAGLEGEVRVGIEGAGSYGAGLCEHLQDNGVEVFEVERPKRRERRTGKSDRLDALLAAKKVLANDGLSTPRGHGKRVALQMLLVAYRSVISERSRLYNQLQALHVGAPGALRERVGPARNGATLARRLTGMRTRPNASLPTAPAHSTSKPRTTLARSTRSHASSHQRSWTNPASGRSPLASSSRSTPRASRARPRSHAPTAPHHNPRPPAKPSDTASAAEATDKSTQRSTQSRSHAPSTTQPAAPTSNAEPTKERPSERP